MPETRKLRIKTKNRTRSIIIFLSVLIICVLLVLITSGFWIKDQEAYKRTQIICGLLALVLGGSLQILLLKFFKGIDIINYNAHLLSKGQLNTSDILVSKAKGLETLCIAFNDMKANLLSFTELTKTNIVTISDAIDKVSKSIESSFKGNEQIASSMGNVAAKAHEQLKTVKDTLDSIYNVDERVHSIEASIASIENFVNSVVDSTNVGNKNLDDYNQQMNVITDNLSSTSGFIDHLNMELKEIYQLGALIINITDQLKMLAFNASIESARSGAAGKGFSVVADQMNKLSEETRKSITKINTLLNNVSASSNNVKTSIVSCIENYDVSKELFSSIKEAFDSIKNNTDILSSDTKKVYSEASVISGSTHEVREKGQDLFNSANKISSETQEVAAVTQEELAGTELISENILSLKNMLNGIERLVKRFKTAVTPVEAVSKKTLKIAFISPLDHEFWVGVKQGVMYAQKELAEKNAIIEYTGFTENSPEKIVKAFAEYLDKGCDGIVAPGFSEELVPLIDKASRKNIPVMIFNCDLATPSKKTAYFGPNINEAGTLAADFMIRALEGKGNVAIFRGSLSVSVHKARTEKIKERLKSKPQIKLVAETEASDNHDVVYDKVKKFLRENKNIDGIFTTGGGIAGAAKAIKELNLVGKTRIVCFDFNKEVFEFIKDDIIYAAIGQDAFGQGHDPIIYIYNYLVANEKPESDVIWTRTDVVDKHNVDDLI
ncbi:substrate-binding domain-containing protein [Pseudobacteroides cellulosolvens]|uniref:Methyl-accepting chemotaxis sensory transducer n=1 Tax=Pseudobacteroides cellulosolvens ATCC 35603 = DSM 2933 TaxID=398512 RepID=A0A0L6JTX5_9FIRM|nr:substrate-binding domain-containing protein [Pseudobacteroides cellulosolvens]KNY29179.1 methyl-accepting chemotaxis sensory transducer [Pseudobacteroides cellulosolvens ATCC 35603 = DSM 2933]